MATVIGGLEALAHAVPLSVWEIWGRASFVVGLVLMIAAFGGFTFRPAGRFGLGRERHGWDTQALLSSALTFAVVFVTGFIGSGIVLVPGAQTFESLKDLSVLLCLLLFGYPALIAVPPAYMLSDLVEGVPPMFLQDWFVGYFINPACFWLAYQAIGKSPDFGRARTWRGYFVFVACFSCIEPPLWGYICSDVFTAEISYRTVTPALLFTTAVSWIFVPFAMLGALPLARRYGLFWAEVPGRVRERLLGGRTWVWQSGRGEVADPALTPPALPIHMFLAAPLIGLIVLMVGAVAYVALERGRDAANTLARRLLEEVSAKVALRLEDPASTGDLARLLQDSRVGDQGRVFILDRAGRLVASSAPGADPAPGALAAASRDRVLSEAAQAVAGRLPDVSAGRTEQFEFDVVTARPLARETWLAQATSYTRAERGVDWVVVAALAEADYLSGVRVGHSQSAMVVAVALILSLLVSPLLAGALTAPILRVSQSAQAMAAGDLSQRVPGSRLEELGTVASAFNYMAEQLQESRRQLDADIHRREEIERILRESEGYLEALVNERTQALASANKQLEAFSYSVSHDLRGPLRVVEGFASILHEHHAAQLDDDGRMYLDRIRRATRKMVNLIDALLVLSRVGRGELDAARVNLSELAEDVVRDLVVTEPDRAVDVRVQPDLFAWADAMLIRQALQNLLGNAWKFTAYTTNPKIELGRAAIDGEDVFFVADNGAGFDMAHAARLFTTFQRLHSTREFEGSGVGLSIVERVITRHGGRVWARGEVGKGATIYFTLPEPPAAAAPPEPPA